MPAAETEVADRALAFSNTDFVSAMVNGLGERPGTAGNGAGRPRPKSGEKALRALRNYCAQRYDRPTSFF